MIKSLTNRLDRLERQTVTGDEAAWRREMDQCVRLVVGDDEGRRLLGMLGPAIPGKQVLAEAERVDVARRLNERLEELQVEAGVAQRGLPRRP